MLLYRLLTLWLPWRFRAWLFNHLTRKGAQNPAPTLPYEPPARPHPHGPRPQRPAPHDRRMEQRRTRLRRAPLRWCSPSLCCPPC